MTQILACLILTSTASAATFVCIGLNAPGNYKPLKFAEKDAAEMADLVRGQGHESVLVVGSEATREKVLEALRRINDEQAVIYFAGHGEKDRLILADGAITLQEIQDVAPNSLMLLDCCYVGGQLRKQGATRVIAAAQYEAFERGQHGLFTKYLLKWIGDGRSFSDEKMIDFLRKGIGKETGGWQKPVLGYA